MVIPRALWAGRTWKSSWSAPQSWLRMAPQQHGREVHRHTSPQLMLYRVLLAMELGLVVQQ